MKRLDIQRLVLAAFFMAFGIVLPFATMHIPEVGQLLSPMHLPVFLCGFICGPIYGALVGLILPLFRFVLFGMPPLFPTGIAMSFELAVYGSVSGLIYRMSRDGRLSDIYKALISSMVLGRLVGGIVQVILLGGNYSINMFVTAYFIKTLPGVILQLVLIPLVIVALRKSPLIMDARYIN